MKLRSALMCLAAACLISPAAALAQVDVSNVEVTDQLLDPVCCKGIWWSTEVFFTCGVDPDHPYRVSDGDLLWDRRDWRVRNKDLIRNLGIMPEFEDLGLDAVSYPSNACFSPDPTKKYYVKCKELYFSTERPVHSETLGYLSDGDLLSTRGAVVRTNMELIHAFDPGPIPFCGVGLDAVHVRPITDASFSARPVYYFSTSRNFFSRRLERTISHGDLLGTNGRILRTNRELLQNFHPVPLPGTIDDELSCCRDYGLDAVWISPRGMIWFSLEEGFEDRELGRIGHGDVLCEDGRIIRDNRELRRVWRPCEKLWDFGCDALDVGMCKLLPAQISSEAIDLDDVFELEEIMP